jgi:hypothetical protein
MTLETEEGCSARDRGIGHLVDINLDDLPYCYERCFTRRTDLRLNPNESIECCGHRHVGEDLVFADAYHVKYEGHQSCDGESNLSLMERRLNRGGQLQCNRCSASLRGDGKCHHYDDLQFCAIC